MRIFRLDCRKSVVLWEDGDAATIRVPDQKTARNFLPDVWETSVLAPPDVQLRAFP